MPVILDAPSRVRIRHRCGDHLGTVVVTVAGHAWEAPVAFGAYRVIPDYRSLACAALARACPEGALVEVRSSGGGLGGDGVLPVIEVQISPDGGSIGEELVRRGWAIPDATALRQHAHDQLTDAYWQALREARADGRGIWGEAGVDAVALGIPCDQALATAPAPHPPPGWNALASLVLVAALALVAARRAPAAPRPRRGGLLGATLRAAEIGVGLMRGAIPPRARPAPRSP